VALGWRSKKPAQPCCESYVPAMGCFLTALPEPLKTDEPLLVFSIANGFAVMRAPTILKTTPETREFWDLKSLTAFLNDHFRWPRDTVTGKPDK